MHTFPQMSCFSDSWKYFQKGPKKFWEQKQKKFSLQKSTSGGLRASALDGKKSDFMGFAAEFVPDPFFIFMNLFYEKLKHLDPNYLTKYNFSIKNKNSIFLTQSQF